MLICIFQLMFAQERLKFMSLNQLPGFYLISVSGNLFKTNFLESLFYKSISLEHCKRTFT